MKNELKAVPNYRINVFGMHESGYTFVVSTKALASGLVRIKGYSVKDAAKIKAGSLVMPYYNNIDNVIYVATDVDAMIKVLCM